MILTLDDVKLVLTSSSCKDVIRGLIDRGAVVTLPRSLATLKMPEVHQMYPRTQNEIPNYILSWWSLYVINRQKFLDSGFTIAALNSFVELYPLWCELIDTYDPHLEYGPERRADIFNAIGIARIAEWDLVPS